MRHMFALAVLRVRARRRWRAARRMLAQRVLHVLGPVVLLAFLIATRARVQLDGVQADELDGAHRATA